MKNFSNNSFPHSIQCSISEGKVFKAQEVYLFEEFSFLISNNDPVKFGMTNIPLAFVPSVPASNKGFLNIIA